MRFPALIVCTVLLSCSAVTTDESAEQQNNAMSFTEKQILGELDLAFNQKPGSYYPAGAPGDIKYNFFPDLEHGYCEIASSRIHLYADSTRWAIVFETAGYENRSYDAEITLIYFGNCIDYPVQKYQEQKYISNMGRIILIEQNEYQRIENKDGTKLETFELIAPNTKDFKIRDTTLVFENDFRKYEEVGIKIRDYDNPKKLIGFGDLVRYLNETNPQVISATEEEIKKHIPSTLPKLLTINEFHFVSAYDKTNLPSQQETYQLIAKVLVSRNASLWKPTLPANNHWRNWESGGL